MSKRPPAPPPTPPVLFKRTTRQVNRDIRRLVAAKTAAEAIGPLAHGCEIYGLNKGQFSLIDIIEHCIAETGPADVTISTWSAAGTDISFAHALLTDGRIRTMRFIVDFSFQTRQPAYCAALRERFGDAALRVTKTHAKFVVIRNATWSVVIRSSMNLNENRRLESFEISDDPEMATYLLELCDELFGTHAPSEQFAKGAWQNEVDFERFAEPKIDIATAEQTAKDKKYFSDRALGQDLRRSGLTFTKTGKTV